MKALSPIRILWTVDAFEDQPELQAKSIQVLRDLAKHATLEIEPVYMLSPDQMGLLVEFTSPLVDQYSPAAKKALNQRLKGVDLPGLLPSKILSHHRPSLKGAAEALCQYAENHDFQLILTGTHGREGYRRMVLGSFAEELLLLSQVPVLVVGAHAEVSKEEKARILFPTDFSESSAAAFNQVLQYAKTIGASLVLHHCVRRPVEALLQSGVYLASGGWIPVPVYIGQEQASQLEVANSWKKQAAEQSIPLEILIDSDSSNILASILKATERAHASMIAMTAESGRVSAGLLGSITRQVLRTAPVPVWVLRARNAAQAAEKRIS